MTPAPPEHDRAGRRLAMAPDDDGADKPRQPAADAPPADLPGADAPPAEAPAGDPPRNPWHPGTPPRRGAGIDDIFRPRPGTAPGRPDRGGLPPFGGRLRGIVAPGGRGWLPWMVAGIVGLWILATSLHQLGSTEQGIVTTFGKYTRTIGPGATLTLPWPVQDVAVSDVTLIRRESIPDGDAEKLMLTGDQNLVDLSYIVRWNIANLKRYSFQLDDPHAAIRDVAEAAMRASVAEVPLDAVMGGAGRAEIEQRVRVRMQSILDAYHAGVTIQGVDIKKADPPDKVVAAFQQVTVAQQQAQRDLSNAGAFGEQVIAKARGEAAAFDLVYAQYKAAPEVTRRRMYYETMEKVLAQNDKVIVEGNTTTVLPLPGIRAAAPPPPPAPTGGQ